MHIKFHNYEGLVVVYTYHHRGHEDGTYGHYIFAWVTSNGGHSLVKYFKIPGSHGGQKILISHCLLQQNAC